MIKKILLLAYGLFNVMPAFTQQLTPAVIASAGDVSKTGKMSLEWTLGEPVIETISSKDQLITQGFHQPLLFVKHGSFNDADKHLEVVIRPNPVQYLCKAYIKRKTNNPLQIELTDINGRKLYTSVSKTKDDVIDLDFTSYLAGTYILIIRDSGGGWFKTFKIIKAL